MLRAAILAGPLQTLLFGKWFVSGHLAFLALRSQQLAPAVERMNVTTQGWFAAVLSIEYLVFRRIIQPKFKAADRQALTRKLVR